MRSFVKTTLELPETLLRELQRRARQYGQEPDELAADLLWKGLAASADEAPFASPAIIQRHSLTGLPYVACSQAASPETEMTPNQVANLLIEQEASWRQAVTR
jgi:hypothetical protein